MTVRILQAVDSLDPVYGGPPTVVLRLAAALAREGADVTVHSTERPGREADIARSLQGIPGMDSVRLVSDVCRSRADRLLGRPAREFLRSQAGRFDVVQIHGLWRPSLQAVLRESARISCPTIITPHGMLAEWSLAQKPWRKRLALALAWRQLLGRAAFVHALTPAEARDFRVLGIDVPVEVIPNGCFLEEMGELPARGTFSASQPELKGKPFILFLGRLHYVKRAELLVQAFTQLKQRLPEVHLVVAGPDCGTRVAIESIMKQYQLRDRVHLPGPLYGPRKYAAMVDALCFCQPSVYETFSMSLLEAMACGTPLVITRGCNFDEVGSAGAGLVVDGGANELAEALASMCGDPAARAAAGQRARDLVVTKYTWPVVARQLLETCARRV